MTEHEFFEYISHFNDMDRISRMIEQRYGHDDIHKVSLTTGYPGICLLLYDYYKYSNELVYYELCNEYFKKTVNIINDTPLYSTSLFSGTMGIIFSLTTCSNNGENYKNVVCQLLLEYEKIFDLRYQFLLNEIDNHNWDTKHFDVISGCSGELLSLLHVYDNYHFNSSLVTEKIYRLSTILEKVLIAYNQNKKKDGVLKDLGLAHGIPGIINILSSVYRRDLGSDELKSILENSFFNLKNHMIFYNNEPVFPFEIGTLSFRDAWCYGNPGISICTYNLGLALNNDCMLLFSHRLLWSTFNRLSQEESKIISPTICHGLSGLFIISNFLENAKLTDIVEHKIYDYKLNNYFFSFLDYEFNAKEGMINSYKDISLLNGSSGIILSLLSKKKWNSTWYKLLMFH
ncbi:lanthionine synthetase C family protein [Staphylococcus equorum]|uniref:lanthionine synthetase C family protein n=1 Tax=Staphylococcus equorum TaxID=246432 RepID=UPI0013008653|nr:lanthionine synthetase C family protein [Staphylococcus equorum]